MNKQSTKLDEVFGPNGKFGKATDDLARTFEGTISMLKIKILPLKRTCQMLDFLIL